jgi:hypothetical protein
MLHVLVHLAILRYLFLSYKGATMHFMRQNINSIHCIIHLSNQSFFF